MFYDFVGRAKNYGLFAVRLFFAQTIDVYSIGQYELWPQMISLEPWPSICPMPQTVIEAANDLERIIQQNKAELE